MNSKIFFLKNRIPQLTRIKPIHNIIFNSYINDVSNTINKPIKYTIFADDLNIFTEVNNKLNKHNTKSTLRKYKYLNS